MEPKFQSSFIPKGPVSGGMPTQSAGIRSGGKDLGSFLVTAIFSISVLLAAGAFLYKLLLNYQISQMGGELDNARAALAPETVTELINLNNRIASTEELIQRHRVLSPLFDFLELSTPRNVRFTEFNFSDTDKGVEMALKGEARGYAALALQADIINKSKYFRNPVFSDINLDERGNVVFSLKASVDSELLSYQRAVENVQLTPIQTSTGTSTPN